MRTLRSQNGRHRALRPLCLEVLEERQVLSLLGLLSTATEPLASTIGLASSDGAEVSAASQPAPTASADGLSLDTQITAPLLGAVLAPLGNALSAGESLVAQAIDLPSLSASDSGNSSAPNGEPGPDSASSASAPGLTLSIGVAPSQVGLLGGNTEETSAPVSTSGTAAQQPAASNASGPPLEILLNFDVVESMPVDESGAAKSQSTEILVLDTSGANQVGVVRQEGGAGIRGSASGEGPALGTPAQALVVATTSPRVAAVIATSEIAQPSASNGSVGLLGSNLAASPQQLLNAAPGGLLQYGSFLANFTPRLPTPANIPAPLPTSAGPALTNINPLRAELDLAADFDPFAPEASGLLTDAAAFDLSAMDRALQDFLDQLDELRDNVGAWFSETGPTPWMLMAFAVAATMHEWLRRRRRAPSAASDLTPDELDMQWPHA